MKRIGVVLATLALAGCGGGSAAPVAAPTASPTPMVSTPMATPSPYTAPVRTPVQVCLERVSWGVDRITESGNAGTTMVVQEFGTESVEWRIIQKELPVIFEQRNRHGREVAVRDAIVRVRQACEEAITYDSTDAGTRLTECVRQAGSDSYAVDRCREEFRLATQGGPS